MKLLFKIIGYTCISFVGLVVLVVIALQFISNDQYKVWITAAAGSATDRELAINGDFDLNIGTTISLLAQDVHFANAEWGTKDDMVSVDRLFVQLAFFPLLKGVLDFTVELDRPDILMETNEQGRGNWVFGTPEVVSEPEQAEETGDPFVFPIKPYIRNFEIKDFAFAFNDTTRGQDIKASIDVLRIFIDGNDIPLSIKATYQDVPVELAGTLGRIEEWYANKQTSISLQGKLNEAVVQVKGTAGPMQPDPDVRIDFLLSADNITTFSPFAGVSLPDIKGVDIKMTALAANGRMGAENIRIKLADPQVKVALNGTVANLSQLAGIDVSLEVIAPSTAALAHKAGLEIPELGALQLDGHLVSGKETLALEAMNGVLKSEGMETRITAVIADVAALAGLEATVESTLESLSPLTTLIDGELPETGPWTLNVQAKSDRVLTKAMMVTAHLDGEGIKTVIGATVPKITSPQIFEAQLSVEADSMSSLDGLLDKELPQEWPLKITGKASGQPGQYLVDEFLVLLGKGKIRADLSYTKPQKGENERPKLAGKMNIQDLDITPLFAVSTDEGEPGTGEEMLAEEVVEEIVEEESPSAKKLFSSEPLTVRVLQGYDFNLKLDATNFTLSKGFTVNSNIAVVLDKGLLKVDPLDIKGVTGGRGDGVLTLDARSPEAKLDIFLDFEDFVLPGIGGKFVLDVDLDGNGQSMAELMGTLNGRFIASLNDAPIGQSFLTRMGGGFLNQINPLTSKETILECAIIRCDVTDGMVDLHKKIAAQTTEVTWVGGGEVNLKTEELDLGFTSKPRKKLSALTHVGLAELIHVGGTLAEPNVGLNAMDVAGKYVGYTAFIATGGLSFLAQKMYDTRTANMNQCERILAEQDEQKQKKEK